MRKAFLAAVLVSAVFLSGCTNEGVQYSQTGGVSIESFNVIGANEIAAGRSAKVRMLVKNIGDAEATGVKAYLYSPPAKSGGSSSVTWGFDSVMPKQFTPNTLTSPVTDMGIEGGRGTLTWTVTAPTGVQKYKTEDYTFKARLYYIYRTVATADIDVMSENEAYRKSEEGETISWSRPVTRNSAGPLQVEVVATQPAVTYGDSMILLGANVKNMGAGTPYKAGSTDEEGSFNKVNIKIELPAGLSYKGGSTITENGADMIMGEWEKMYEISANDVPTAGVVTYGVKVTVDYGYFEDASASITVRGTSG